MAASATRTASREARVAEAVATGPLGALSHDALGVIFDGLADPLQPVVAVALSSTCLGLRTPLQAALEVLKERHARAVALCCKIKCPVHVDGVAVNYVPMTCVLLRDAEELDCYLDPDCRPSQGLTADDMATIAMLLDGGSLPRLNEMNLSNTATGDACMKALCDGLHHGAAPGLLGLAFASSRLGPVGTKALAAALKRGALPNLEGLQLANNLLGDEGAALLASAARKLPALKDLTLWQCEIGDEGVASLVASLGKDDFKKLEMLDLQENKLTDRGFITLASELNQGRLPMLRELLVRYAPDDGAIAAELEEAASRRKINLDDFEPQWDQDVDADSDEDENDLL